MAFKSLVVIPFVLALSCRSIAEISGETLGGYPKRENLDTGELNLGQIGRQFGSDERQFEPIFKLIEMFNRNECTDEIVGILREVSKLRDEHLNGILLQFIERIAPICEQFWPTKNKKIEHPVEVEKFKVQLIDRLPKMYGTDDEINWPIEFMSRLDSEPYFSELEQIKWFVQLAGPAIKLKLRQVPLNNEEISKMMKKWKKSDDKQTLKLREIMEDKLFELAGYIVDWEKKFLQPAYEFVQLISKMTKSNYGQQFVLRQPKEYKARLFQYRACLDILKMRESEWRLRKIYFEPTKNYLSSTTFRRTFRQNES